MADTFNFDVDFQKQILRLLLDKEYFTKYYHYIKIDYFSNEIHRIIYKIITNHYGKYSELPSDSSIKEEINKLYKEGRVTDVSHISEEFTDISKSILINETYTVDKIIEFAKHQAMKNAILLSVKALERGDFNSIEKYMEEAYRVRSVEDIGFEYFKSLTDDKYLGRFDFRDFKIPTLIQKLDRVLNGGLDKKELGVILGPSKRGKSMLLTNLGKAAIIFGKKIVHYTFELSSEKTKSRYDSSFTGFEYNKLSTLTSEIKKKLRKIKQQHVVGESLIIKEYPTKSCTVGMIDSHLSMLEGLGFKPDMLVVDYADLMKPKHYTGNTYSDVGSVYDELRGMAMKRKLAIWTASQSIRSSFDKALVTMEDASDSVEKIRIADLIITLCQTKEERREIPPKMRLYIAGAREVEDQIFIPVRSDFARILMLGEKE